MGGISIATQSILFNTAYWIFASEYYKTANSIPFAIKPAIQLPMDQMSFTKLQTWLTVANFIAPILDGASSIAYVSYLFEHKNKPSQLLGFIWIGCSYLVGLLQSISGIFMLLALKQIKAVLRQGIKADDINHKAMALHASSYIFYMFTLVIYYFFYTLEVIQKHNSETWFYSAWIVSCLTNFTS